MSTQREKRVARSGAGARAANKERGEFAIVSNGKSYVMKLTTNAMCAAETLSNHTFDEIVFGALNGRVSDIRLFLWMALQEHHAGVSVQDVGNIIDGTGGLEDLKKQFEALMELNTKEGKDAQASGRPPNAQGGTGASST